jgi:outer membrane protein assembly factor BamB
MRKIVRLACLAGCVALTTGWAEAADWPQWLGPTRNDVSPATVAPWKGKPQVVWRKKIGKAFSSPIVADGLVFVHASVADKDIEEVIALDAQTGERRWRDSYPRAKYRSQLGAGPRATPSYADGKLVTYGITGVLTAYDARTGARLWQVNPYEDHKLTLPRFGVCSSPILSQARAVVLVGGAGFAVAAYDMANGKLAWKALDEPAGSASPTVLPAAGPAGDEQIVVQTTLRLAGLNPKDGAIHWEQPLVFEPAGVSPTPFVVGDLLLCTTQDSGTLAVTLPRETQPSKGHPEPAVKWRKPDLSGYFSTGTVGPDGTVLIVTNSLAPLPRADLRCLDPANGNELWKKENLGYFHFAVTAIADGRVLILDDGGTLILAQTTRKGYQELAKAKVCLGTFNSPALANGRLYVRDNVEVICLDLGSSAVKDSSNKTTAAAAKAQ